MATNQIRLLKIYFFYFLQAFIRASPAIGISEKTVMRLGQDLGNSSSVSAYQDMIRALPSRIIDEKILIHSSAAGKASDGRKKTIEDLRRNSM